MVSSSILQNRGHNFLISAGSDTWNVNCLPSYSEQETGTNAGTADENVHLKKEERESCWQCYKLFPKAQAVKDENGKKVFIECH